MTYERNTAAPIRDVLRIAEDILTDRIPTIVTDRGRHSIRFDGGDGVALIEAHRHGVDTLVSVTTDQLRTSRLDTEVQYFLTLLPYQPGDVTSSDEAAPGGLSRSLA
jgi:hypothetical protein